MNLARYVAYCSSQAKLSLVALGIADTVTCRTAYPTWTRQHVHTLRLRRLRRKTQNSLNASLSLARSAHRAPASSGARRARARLARRDACSPAATAPGRGRIAKPRVRGSRASPRASHSPSRRTPRPMLDRGEVGNVAAHHRRDRTGSSRWKPSGRSVPQACSRGKPLGDQFGKPALTRPSR